MRDSNSQPRLLFVLELAGIALVYFLLARSVASRLPQKRDTDMASVGICFCHGLPAWVPGLARFMARELSG